MKKIILALALATACAAQAAPITYNINRTISTGSVVGTLVTDGTIGALASANIMSWNFTIDDGHGDGAFQLTSGVNAGLYLSSASVLFGDADSLDFNFAGSGFALFQSPGPGSGQNWWCLESVGSNCAGSGAGETVNRFGAAAYQFRNTQAVIGTVDAVQAVPEPGSLALAGLAMVALLGARRNKRL